MGLVKENTTLQKALKEGFDINKYGDLLKPEIHGSHRKFTNYVKTFIDEKYSGGSAKEWIENVAIPHIKSIVEKAKAQNISLDKVVNGK